MGRAPRGRIARVKNAPGEAGEGRQCPGRSVYRAGGAGWCGASPVKQVEHADPRSYMLGQGAEGGVREEATRGELGRMARRRRNRSRREEIGGPLAQGLGVGARCWGGGCQVCVVAPFPHGIKCNFHFSSPMTRKSRCITTNYLLPSCELSFSTCYYYGTLGPPIW